MFTIKHVWDNGAENLWMGSFPQFNPPLSQGASAYESQLQPGLNQPNNAFIAFDDESGERHQIYGGTVYIMNDTGKTIAKYHLGGEMSLTQALMSDGGRDSR